jgi:hypothetical protein
MMQKSDSGLSVAIGFIMLLMIIALIIGTWALVGVPEQTRNAESYHAIGVTNAFLDYKIGVDDLRLNNQSGVNVSMLIPAASAYSSGALRLSGNVGTLSIFSNESLLLSEVGMSRLSATFGTTNTYVGYEGGGVFRSDYGYATWVTPPMFELDNLSNELYVTMVVPRLNGSFFVGSTEGIPVDTGWKNSSQWEIFSTNHTVTINYNANEEWDAQLWYTAFYEAVEKYENDENAGKIANVTCSPGINGNTASLLIHPVSGKIIHIHILYPEYDVDVRSS